MAENPKRQGKFLTISLVFACVVLPAFIVAFQSAGLIAKPDFFVMATSLVIAILLTITLFYFIGRHYSLKVSGELETLEQQLSVQIKKNEESNKQNYQHLRQSRMKHPYKFRQS